MSDHTVAVEAKVIWKSKEFWTNVIGFLIIILTYIIDPASELKLPEQANSYIRLAVFALQTALTLFFRVYATDRPIAFTSHQVRHVKAPRGRF